MQSTGLQIKSYIRTPILLLLFFTSLGIAGLNLSVPYHKIIDWDTAFWVGMTRAGFSTCCLHPLQDNLWWVYGEVAEMTGEPLVALQLFFFVFIVLGSVLYGLLFQIFFRRAALSLLAAMTYPLFPVIQNLSAYYEDNLFKIPFLMATLVFIFHRRGSEWTIYVAIALFSYTCLLAMDALLWGPIVTALILWRIFKEHDRPINENLLFVTKSALFGVAMFWGLSTFHDWISERPFGSGLKEYLGALINPTGGGIKNFSANPFSVDRYISYPLEQIEPLFGLLQVFDGESLTNSKSWRDLNGPLRAFTEKRHFWIFLVAVFHLVNTGILLYSLIKMWCARSTSGLLFVSIVLCGYVSFFLFNYIYIDVPDERYDHYLLMLPLILLAMDGGNIKRACHVKQNERALAHTASYGFLYIFIFLGILHFIFAPYKSSNLYRFSSENKQKFEEYYFSIEEISTTGLAEELYLAGYAPLKIVNTDAREESIFSPLHMERRTSDELKRYWMEQHKRIFLSPRMISYLDGNQ